MFSALYEIKALLTIADAKTRECNLKRNISVLRNAPVAFSLKIPCLAGQSQFSEKTIPSPPIPRNL
jgi:hypothetical protein